MIPEFRNEPFTDFSDPENARRMHAALASVREQFGRPIASFGLMQQKLAEMAVRIYAVESAGYRTAALLDDSLARIDQAAGERSAATIKEQLLECSIIKVLASEVLDRVVALLEALSRDDAGLTLLELSERLGLHKSTAHRLLMVLERHRFVEKIRHGGRYGLGLKLFELGTRSAAHLGLGQRARPYLERLVAEVGETAHLCILDDGEVLYLEKVEPSRAVRAPSSVGRRNPAHCTAVGKALLAFVPQTDLDAMAKRHGLRAFTRNTITSLPRLKRELALVRQRGYAIDDEEIEEGLVCIGAPIRDYSGSVVASMSVAGPAFRLSRTRIPIVANLVTQAAAEFSASLGYRGSSKGASVRRRMRSAAG